MQCAACGKGLRRCISALQLPEEMATKTPQKSTTENIFSLISNSKLQQMYSTMLQYRILESHARKLVGGKSMRGKEATLVGAAIDLLPGDALAIVNNTGIAGFLKKMPIQAILSELHQRAAKKTKERKTRPALASAEGASQGAIATGIALANRNASDNITLAFLSHAADHAGTFAFARIHKLPVIYVNTGAAVDQQEAQSYGFPVIPVDGNDVVAIYRVAFECMLRARQGGGPSMLSCVSFPSELSAAKSQDPLRNMERYLTGKGLFTEAWKQSLIHTFEKDVKQALAATRKKAPGKKSEADYKIFML
jgi:TPP-dependent pyruvate/acetoin dehydrogenase alpha subunit